MKISLATLGSIAATASAQNLTAALSAEPSISNLTAFIAAQQGIVATLSSLSGITVLAPNNDAVAALMNSSMASILTGGDTALITALLTYHVINATINSSQITDTPAFAPTLLNNATYTNVTGGQVVEAVKEGDSVEIFSGLRMNATVTKADIKFDGGVIHVIDSFLVPPQNISTTAVAVGLSSLVGAVTKAGVGATVDTAKDLTVFAPNNDAFKAIGSVLPNVSVEDLGKIIGYHAIVGAPVLYSSALTNGSFKTFEGSNLTVKIEDGDVFVNQAKVVQADVLLSNGVLHVIDAVLNPGNATATRTPDEETPAPVYPGASSVSDFPLTSGVPPASTSLGGAAPTTSGGAAASSTPAPGVGARPTGAVGAVAAGALFAVGGYLVV